jgi:hypothetical protein
MIRAGLWGMRKSIRVPIPSLPGLTLQSIEIKAIFLEGDGCPGQARA